jgi:hypothetical protein
MKVVARKMKKLGFVKLQLVLGALIMAAAVIVPPVGIISYDASLMANPFILGVVAIGMLFFGLVGFFGFVRPYFLYSKAPEVLAETDGEFLYIHANREGKIPLANISEAFVHVSYPFLFSRETLKALIVHLLSEEYGDIHLEIEEYGKFRMRFVSHVGETAGELERLISSAINNG